MKHQPLPSTHHLSGMFYAIVGYGVVTCFDVILKLISQQGYPQAQMMATTGGFCALMVFFIALASGGIKRLATRKLKFQLLRGSLGLVAFTCGFYAIRHIPLVDFYGIVFAVPIIITVLSVVWLKEHVGRPRWIAILFGFIGVTIMLRAGTSHAPSAVVQLGYVAALGCALFNAIATVMVRRYGRAESNLTFSFYAALCNVAVSGILWAWQGGIAYQGWDCLALAFAGALVGVGSIFLMTAFQHSPPAAIVPFQYTQLIWGALLGYFLFHDVPSFWSLMGAGIVISSGWFVLWREAQLARALKRTASVMKQAS